MLAGVDGAVAPPEDPFPLGPFPRHIWIHNHTPQDSLDEVCYEIWKRAQWLSAELLATGLHSDLPGILPRGTTTFQSHSFLLDEPKGLEDIYRAMTEKREREMKLRALSNFQLSAKPVASSFPCSTKSQKNSKGLEDGKVAGARSRLEVPFPQKCPVNAKGVGDQVMVEEKKVVKGFMQSSVVSSTKGSAAAPSTAAAGTQTAGQKQQLPPPPLAEICSKPNAYAGTKNPVTTTATSDKKYVKNYASSSVTAATHEPVWKKMSFPRSPNLPNHSNFPQYEGPFHPRARIPSQQALSPPFGYPSAQAAPYNPQLLFWPPYVLMPNCISLVQPGHPYKQIPTAAQPGNIWNLAPMAGNGIQYTSPPSYRFSSVPGRAVMTNSNYSYL